MRPHREKANDQTYAPIWSGMQYNRLNSMSYIWWKTSFRAVFCLQKPIKKCPRSWHAAKILYFCYRYLRSLLVLPDWGFFSPLNRDTLKWPSPEASHCWKCQHNRRGREKSMSECQNHSSRNRAVLFHWIWNTLCGLSVSKNTKNNIKHVTVHVECD